MIGIFERLDLEDMKKVPTNMMHDTKMKLENDIKMSFLWLFINFCAKLPFSTIN